MVVVVLLQVLHFHGVFPVTTTLLFAFLDCVNPLPTRRILCFSSHISMDGYLDGNPASLALGLELCAHKMKPVTVGHIWLVRFEGCFHLSRQEKEEAA